MKTAKVNKPDVLYIRQMVGRYIGNVIRNCQLTYNDPINRLNSLDRYELANDALEFLLSSSKGSYNTMINSIVKTNKKHLIDYLARLIDFKIPNHTLFEEGFLPRRGLRYHFFPLEHPVSLDSSNTGVVKLIEESRYELLKPALFLTKHEMRQLRKFLTNPEKPKPNFLFIESDLIADKEKNSLKAVL